MIKWIMFLLQMFLKVSSISIAIITIYYIIGLIKFIFDTFYYYSKEKTKFGLLLFIVFLIIAIPANLALFYIVW